tara:strand:+ start:252 stop:647 length:396 start_codon:yes stop_codon:yes gene_type:complete
MIIDRFTKLGLSILVFSLCLNALNPWLSPALANAEIEDTEVKNAMKIIAQAINRIADAYEKQEQRALREEQRALREEQRSLMRYEKQEQRALKRDQLIPDLMQIVRDFEERARQRALREEQRSLILKELTE